MIRFTAPPGKRVKCQIVGLKGHEFVQYNAKKKTKKEKKKGEMEARSREVLLTGKRNTKAVKGHPGLPADGPACKHSQWGA